MNNKKEELPKYIDDDWKNEGLKTFILFIIHNKFTEVS